MACGIHKFDFEIGLDFFKNMECEDVSSADVKVTLDVDHNGELYRLAFSCQGSLGIPCDRCLEEMTHQVSSSYGISVKYGDEFNDESDDELIIPESFNKLNVAQMIFETIMLSIPICHSHDNIEDCNPDMVAYLTEHKPGDSEEETVDPRWAALKDIKE